MGYFDKFNKGAGIPFMDNAEKLDMAQVCNAPLHITDYGFITGRNGRFAVLQFAELPNSFVFGGKVITDDLDEMQADLGTKAETLKMLKDVTVTFTKEVSKTGNEYYAVTFTEETLPF